MLTVAPSRSVSSASVTVRAPSTAFAASFSVYGSAPGDITIDGGLFAAVTVTSRPPELLGSPPASVTWNATDRVAVDGLLELLSYVTERSAAWYVATLATPVRVSTPV